MVMLGCERVEPPGAMPKGPAHDPDGVSQYSHMLWAGPSTAISRRFSDPVALPGPDWRDPGAPTPSGPYHVVVPLLTSSQYTLRLWPGPWTATVANPFGP